MDFHSGQCYKMKHIVAYLFIYSYAMPPFLHTSGNVSDYSTYFYFFLKPAHRYAIDHHTDPERLYHIDPKNGSITILKSLDREVSKWHNISVLASEMSK